MKKLIQGIVDFRQSRRQKYAETFAQLALGQKPDALFIACSDSRVAVNVFASSDPGDLFVHRNIGNIVPPFGEPIAAGTAAAVDFAVENLQVRDIIVCGHSDCGGIRARLRGFDALPEGPLKAWLQAGAPEDPPSDIAEASRKNVLAQIDRLRGYPSVARAIADRGLRLHGLWFDIRPVDVWYYENSQARWTIIDHASGERILAGLDG